MIWPSTRTRRARCSSRAPICSAWGSTTPFSFRPRSRGSRRTTSSASASSTSRRTSGTALRTPSARRVRADGDQRVLVLGAGLRVEPAALIVTVRNEAGTVGPLLDSILSGTRVPDEIVIADGGSTDGTWEILGTRASADPRIRAVLAPGNRSVGRNAAVRASRSPVIACTDAGVEVEPEWLERITRPFDEPGIDVVAGFYLPVGATPFERAAGLVFPAAPPFRIRGWGIAGAGSLLRAARRQVRPGRGPHRGRILLPLLRVAASFGGGALRRIPGAPRIGEDRVDGAGDLRASLEAGLRRGLPDRLPQGAAHPSCPISSGPGLSSGLGLKIAASSL